MAGLCLFLGSAVRAQSLKIGDKVPDLTINNVTNYTSSSLKLSEFRGRILILDFWATWCAPCVSMIPRMDSLQKQFAGKIQFLSITSQSAGQVKAFKTKLEKQKNTVYSVPDVVEDSKLKELFPHSTLPHYVWIDQDGVVLAMTEFKDVSAANIETLLREKSININVKKDTSIAFNRNKPFLVGNNGGDGTKLVYHSVLTDFTPGLGSGLMIWRDSAGMKIMGRNLCLAELYRLSYRENGRYLSLRKAVFDVKEPAKLIAWKFGKEYEDWLQDKNGYCYELVVPPELSSQAYTMMQQDLARLFPAYQSSVEKRKARTLLLISTADDIPFKTKGGEAILRLDPFGAKLVNIPIERFLSRLKMQYLQSSYPEILNETGYKGNIDLDLVSSLSDLKSLNTALEKYKLRFVEADREIETLVIRDRQK